MAGRVRQPIDIKALEAYIEKNVPEIKVPLDVKQVGSGSFDASSQSYLGQITNGSLPRCSSASVNRTQHTSSPPARGSAS